MRMQRIRTIGLLICGLLPSVAAHALDIEQVESHYQDKQYQLTLTAVLDAPIERVQAVLRDYRHYPQLDARILEAQTIASDAPHEVLLATKLRVCFGVFCKTVKRVERVQELHNELVATVVPEQSEVTSGVTRTQLASLAEPGARTRVTYSIHIAPGFWIPAFVGRPLMLRTLRETSIELFRKVEQQAQSKAV